jgi:hypothetical protein
VVFTGLVFSKTMLSRTHPFSNIIFFISLCDMLGSIAISFGYPPDGSVHCYAQSFMLFFFFPASWLWTTALVYQLNSMMFFKKLKISMFALHCICWSTALLVALVPLSQNDYGQDDDLAERSVCYLKSDDKQRKEWWLFGMFYGLLLICVTLMIYWMVSSYRQIRTMRTTTFTDYKERAIYKATRWYPLGLLLTWSLSIVVTIMLAIYSDVRVDYIQAGQIAQTQYGTLLALIFFSNSKIVRHRWRELFRKVVPCWPADLRPALSTDSRASEESLDPEGDKFSEHESMIEGPRLSHLVHNLGGRLAQLSGATTGTGKGISASRGESMDSDGEGGSEGGIRVSTYVRDWLVSKTRSSMEHASRINSTADSTVSGASASVHSGSTTGSGGRSTPTSPVAGTGAPVVSPLAAALERAKADRAAGSGSGSGSSSPKAVSGTSSPKSARSKAVLGAIKEEHVEV